MANPEMMAATKSVLWNQLYTSWITAEIFSFTLWFTILFLFVSYLICWKLLDKSTMICFAYRLSALVYNLGTGITRLLILSVNPQAFLN